MNENGGEGHGAKPDPEVLSVVFSTNHLVDAITRMVRDVQESTRQALPPLTALTRDLQPILSQETFEVIRRVSAENRALVDGLAEQLAALVEPLPQPTVANLAGILRGTSRVEMVGFPAEISISAADELEAEVGREGSVNGEWLRGWVIKNWLSLLVLFFTVGQYLQNEGSARSVAAFQSQWREAQRVLVSGLKGVTPAPSRVRRASPLVVSPRDQRPYRRVGNGTVVWILEESGQWVYVQVDDEHEPTYGWLRSEDLSR